MLFFAGLLATCTENPKNIETPSPATSTPFPSQTPTVPPKQAETQSGVLTLAARPTSPPISFSLERFYVYEGEYSFIPPIWYPFQTQAAATFTGSQDRSFLIGLTGGPKITDKDLEVFPTSDSDLADYFLNSIFTKNGSYSFTNPTKVTIGGKGGTSFE
jgi:hypothetical protein